MILTDTHTHLYLNDFQSDRDEIMKRAFSKNVQYLLLPNIDSSSINDLHQLCDTYPDNCFPMMGLHPGSVKENYRDELKIIEMQLKTRDYVAVGEIGIDLYWDKTFAKEQEYAFRFQLDLALDKKLPVAIHQRESYEEIIKVIRHVNNPELTGVFHCFTGSHNEALEIISLGFKLGLGGVLTFKNSKLSETMEKVDLEHIILETDSPYLTPAPFRGKRNESSYVYHVAEKLAEIKNTTIEEVAKITTANANRLFKFKK
jgi:TatD DNase family protein